jgi:TctA family transporter
MLAGIYYGAQYGGSTTAILVNLPGESSAVVTALDGYPMARRGRAGLALATAALASFLAGSIATLLIAVLAPALAEVALTFGPADYFSLMMFGLVAAVILASGSVVKALGMLALGFLLGSIGTDVNTGFERFTFGVPQFGDGIEFAVVAMGIFGIGETIANLERREETRRFLTEVRGLMPTLAELKAMLPPALRGTALGAGLGLLPGGGPTLAAFSTYSLEKKVSKHPEEFGKGALAGVAGPEAANNAAAQASFIPMLTLGLPSNAVMALMIGAMVIQGIQPGPEIILKQPGMFWGLIVSMWIGNLMLVLLNLPLIGLWVRFLTVPYPVLVVAVTAFSAVGIYSASGTVFSMYELAFFSLSGYLLIKVGCEPAPLTLGFILGPMMEEQLRRAMLMSRGDPTVFLADPISLTFLLLAAAGLILVSAPAIARRREQAFSEE